MKRFGALFAVLACAVTSTACSQDDDDSTIISEESLLSASPTVTNISPAQGEVAGGTAVEIAGSGFGRGVTVTFGGVDVDVDRVSRTLLRVTAPAHAAGVVDVRVKNIRGRATVVTGAFRYVEGTTPAPTPTTPEPPPGPTPTATPPSSGPVAVGPAAITAPAGAVMLAPGDDIQSKVDANPGGTTFYLKAGVYRMQNVEAKAGDVFIGELGAVLSGARVLTAFTKSGNAWVVSGQTQEGALHGDCLPTHPRCNHPEELFIDDARMHHVATLAEVGPGKWFFDYAGDKIYIGDDPNGRRVETSVTHAAFSPTQPNVTVKNFVVEKYANAPQMGAIGDFSPGIGWRVENNEVRNNHGVGFSLGDGGVGRFNFVHHNGQLGIAGVGKNITFESNEISFNNMAGVNDGWEAGGSKFALTDGLKVRCNYVHDNRGPGLWTDIDNDNVLYEGNLVTDNESMGIFHEISYRAVIRKNIVLGNAKTNFPWLYGSQILLSTSQGSEVYDNIVEVSAVGGNALAILQQERGTGPRGIYRGADNYVHDNQITLLGSFGGIGAVADWDEANFWATNNNRWDANHYHYKDVSENFFAWNGTDHTWDQFRALGFEVNGTRDSVITVNTTPRAVPACSP